MKANNDFADASGTRDLTSLEVLVDELGAREIHVAGIPLLEHPNRGASIFIQSDWNASNNYTD